MGVSPKTVSPELGLLGYQRSDLQALPGLSTNARPDMGPWKPFCTPGPSPTTSNMTLLQVRTPMLGSTAGYYEFILQGLRDR
jgi:hypothetical protein